MCAILLNISPLSALRLYPTFAPNAPFTPFKTLVASIICDLVPVSCLHIFTLYLLQRAGWSSSPSHAAMSECGGIVHIVEGEK